MTEARKAKKETGYEKIEIEHIRLHTGYQIKQKVYQSFDSKAHAKEGIKMFFLPDSGCVEVFMQGETHIIGSGMWHGARKAVAEQE